VPSRLLAAVGIALLISPQLPSKALALAPGPVHTPPDPGRAAPFNPTLLPSTSGSPVDCVIVAPDSLADIYQRLADFQTRTGRSTVVRGLSTVRALDPRSNDLAQAVRSFLRSAYELWGTRWAILAADHEGIPLRMVRVLLPTPQDIPTDAYYADLDGTWDRNGNGIYGEVADSLDMIFDLSVGRLSASNRADANTLVDKAIQYMKKPLLPAAWRNLFLADVLSPAAWVPGQLVTDDGAWTAESLIVRSAGCATTLRYYENYTAHPGSTQLTKAAALTALARGNHLVIHIGHGSHSQLGIGSEIATSTELAGVDNGDSAAIWVSNNCASAAVDYECVAERLVRRPTGGALAYIGATRDAWPDNDAVISMGLFERVFGTAWPTIGEAMAGAVTDLMPAARSETLARWGYFEAILLGVPSMRVWKCPPQTLTVTRPSSVPIGSPSFTVTVTLSGAPVESALVTAWKAGEDYRSVRTNASGQAVVPFHAATTGSFSLAVDSPGKLPTLDSLTVTSSLSARYAVLNGSARDDLGGDADGSLGTGETFGIGGTIRNGGNGAGAGPLTVTLQAVTSGVVVDVAAASAPQLAAGATTSVPTALRAHALATPNSARTERVRLLVSDGARTDTTEIPVLVGAPVGLIAANVFSDTGTGNGNGTLDPGETATFSFTIANDGSARARVASVTLQNPASGVTLIDTGAALGDIPAGTTATTSALRFQVSTVPSGRLFDLKLLDTYGHTWIFPMERIAPAAPGGVRVEFSAVDRIVLAWNPVGASDLLGYRIYRGPNDTSTPQLLTPIPIRSIPSYENGGLSNLTAYRYQVTAVDSSGNEGPRSSILVASTTPPSLSGWPALLGESTSSNICLADLDHDGRPEILAAGEYLYAFRSDGTDWIDGDQNPVTTGIFTTLLHHIASSPAAADIDFDGLPEIIAASWNDSTVAVFRSDGTLMPGWPRKGSAPFWSVPAVGDIDGDGEPEICIGSNGSYLYAWNVDGSEVRDGDSNPATQGVYFVPLGTVISSPAIADIDKDGQREVIFGTSAGLVYALSNGVPKPGWPFSASGLTSSSPAIGDIVPGGGLEVAITSSNDSVYVLTSTGARAPGWPKPLELTPGNGRVPSPVLAPLRKQLGDPSLDVIICGTDGKLTAFGPTGNVLPGWSSVQVGITEASPAVADLDGDGSLEVLIGCDDRRLYAFHYDGTPVAGFPIETGAELRSTPAIWDLNGDGACDIVVAGWDRSVYAWRYPGTFQSAGMAWPMFHHDNWRTGVATFPVLTSVDSLPSETPSPVPALRASLGQNHPNPFNPWTVIGYSVPGQAPLPVTLRIYSVAGRLVRTLVSRRVEPGYHEVRWDGRDDLGHPTASGTYFYRAEIGPAAFTRKMALLR
jgi:Peptidase family C25/FG-GAP-like repeat/FlgD Ig-like domain